MIDHPQSISDSFKAPAAGACSLLDYARTPETTLEYALHITGATAGLIGVIAPGEDELQLQAVQGYPPEVARVGIPWPLDEDTLGRVAAAGTPSLARDLANVELGEECVGVLPAARSQLAVPLLHEGDVLGVILLESKQPTKFGPEDLASVARLADHAALVRGAQLYQEIKQADRAKSDLISILAHEIRTPLTMIKGYSDLLIKGNAGQLNETQLQFVNIVLSNADCIGTLVNDLLDLSRIETGRAVLDIQPVSMQWVIGEALHPLRESIEAKQQQVTIDVPDDLPGALGDEARLIQVLVNLVGNACKYTPDGGCIVVEVRLDGTSEDGRGMLVCRVRDSGIGMSPEDMEKIWDKFFRAPDPRVGDVPGYGLGLSIAKSLVERHGGRMEVHSVLNEGSVFSFTIPAA